MTKAELENLVDTYQKKADAGYKTYQETGLTRYDSQRRKNEALAAALRMALNAKDDHDALVRLRSELAILAHEAERVKLGFASPDMVIDGLASLAKTATGATKL